MNCNRCGAVNDASVTFCVRCGQPLSSSGARSRQGMAITAMVLGIVSLPLACVGVGLLTGLVALILGIMALVKANRYPAEYGGKGFAIAGLATGGLVLLMLPMYAAILIPSLLRARQAANESAAVGDIRTLVSAQATYASFNGNYYDKLECLAQPRQCVPGDSAPQMPLIDSQLANVEVRRGYQFSLHLGPQVLEGTLAGISPSSVTGFAYVAVPVKVGSTGQRAFCGDDTGVVRYSPDGTAPVGIVGRCPETWSTQGQ